jgi:hypothetical protein
MRNTGELLNYRICFGRLYEQNGVRRRAFLTADITIKEGIKKLKRTRRKNFKKEPNMDEKKTQNISSDLADGRPCGGHLWPCVSVSCGHNHYLSSIVQ